jgi:hypothetical protein
MRRPFAVLVLMLLTATAAAEVICRGDFETGDTKQWKGAPKAGVTGVTDPVRDGKYALRIDGTNAARRGKLDRIEFQHQPACCRHAPARISGALARPGGNGTRKSHHRPARVLVDHPGLHRGRPGHRGDALTQ